MPKYSIEDLQIFAAIARNGSFRATAIERGVSPSALSQTMRSLEERIGMRLLNRTTRSVAPTEAGEQLLPHLVPALEDIALAMDRLNSFRDSPSGTIRINAPGPAADHILCPLVFDFMAAYPDVHVEVFSDAAIIDIVEQGFDAGVRFGEQLAQDMIAVPLGPPLRYTIVGSPDYVMRMGAPKTPHDLVRHNCIRHRFPGGSISTWSFEKGDETVEIVPEGKLTLSASSQETKAALAGLGLAHVFDDYTREHIREGTLVEVLKDWSPTLPSWYLYYPSRRYSPASMQAFVRFLARYKWKQPVEGL